MINKKQKLKYKVWTVRLSEENILWLKGLSKEHKSWNMLFNTLRSEYNK